VSPRLLLPAAEAGVRLTVIHIGVRLLRGPRLMRVLGPARPPTPEDLPQPAVWRRARRVAVLVDRVADRLPWRPACLARAVTTRAMLHRRGIRCELHLGLTGTRPLAAHAWVTAGGGVVQGGPVGPVTPVATLP
jgi:hypothetical protein